MSKLEQAIKKMGLEVSFVDEVMCFGNDTHNFMVEDMGDHFYIEVFDEAEDEIIAQKEYKTIPTVLSLIKKYN